MPKSASARDDLAGYVRDLIVRLERIERHTHNLPFPAPPGPAPAPPFVPTPEPTLCIPDVMGSSSWIANSGRGDMRYNPDGYYASVGDPDGMMIWPDGFAGSQSVEVTISNFGLPAWSFVLTSDYVHLECRRGMTANGFIDDDALRLSIYKFEGATVGSEPFNYTWWIEYDSVGYEYFPEIPPGQSYLAWPFGPGPVTARLESEPDGSYSAWINDTLLVSDVVPGQPLGPTRLGFATETNYFPQAGETYEPGVPHISDICLIADEPECVPTFFDSFDRADGAIGSNWLLLPNAGYAGASPYPFAIESGAAINPSAVFPAADVRAQMRWHEEQVGNQVIEVVIENAEGNNGYFDLITNANGASDACMLASISFFDAMSPPWVPTADDELYVVIEHVNATGPSTNLGSVSLAYLGEPVSVRFESDTDGTQRVLVNGALVLTAVDPSPVVGPYVGMAIAYNPFLGTPYTSARILSASGGCLA